MRDSLLGAVIPIWAGGTFGPVRVRLIRGESELLLGVDIVKKMDSAVNFGSDQFKVGKSEWGMMTFNEKHRRVFPLVPTSCDYA